jgi:hypothetical protein
MFARLVDAVFVLVNYIELGNLQDVDAGVSCFGQVS